MVINDSLTAQFLNLPGSDRLSYKKKIADNYAWARQRMDYLCNQYNYYNERKEKFKINYELYNGRMDFTSYINTGNIIENELGMDIPEIEINQSDFIHFPILQNVLHDLEGEEIKNKRTSRGCWR